MKEYNVYIDESGDEGIRRGSKYFILTAVLVDRKKDAGISKCIDVIKENLEMSTKSQLHWNTLKGYPNKMMIVSEIEIFDITIINIVIDTYKVKYIPTADIYNHFSGYLYERICWFVRDKNAVANIFVSSRGENLRKDVLVNFLNSHNNKDFKIDYTKIKDIKIIPNSQKKLLQLADCCCSALGQALKYHDEIHFRYVAKLESKYYRYNDNYCGYGLKYVPTDVEKDKEYNDLMNYLISQKK